MFIPDNIMNEILSIVWSLLLILYSRMRGKDFSLKFLRKQASLKRSTRATQAVLANPKKAVLANPKTYDKERNEKKKNDKVDDYLDRYDHALFQKKLVI